MKYYSITCLDEKRRRSFYRDDDHRVPVFTSEKDAQEFVEGVELLVPKVENFPSDFVDDPYVNKVG